MHQFREGLASGSCCGPSKCTSETCYIPGHLFILKVSEDFQKAKTLQTTWPESNPNSTGGLVVGLTLQKRLQKQRANDEEANLAIARLQKTKAGEITTSPSMKPLH